MLTIDFAEKLADMLGFHRMKLDGMRELSITIGSEGWIDYAVKSSWPDGPFLKTTMRSVYTFQDAVDVVDMYNIFIYTDIVESTRLVMLTLQTCTCFLCREKMEITSTLKFKTWCTKEWYLHSFPPYI